MLGQRNFLGRDKVNFCKRNIVNPALAKNAPNTRIGVLQIGGGVALQGEHFVPVKNIVALAIIGEVGIL